MASVKLCVACGRSPLGVFKPVRNIRGQWYCLTCAKNIEGGTVEGRPSEDGAVEDGAVEGKPSAPAMASQNAATREVKNQPWQASDPARYYCTQCHTHTNTAKMKGNGWIELVLYFFYILPGVIYSIWRRSGKPNGCPTCGHAALIPAGSGEPSPDTHVRCPDCAELVRREARKCKHCGCALVPQ